MKEGERFIQTVIGWLISDLSRKHPEEANDIVLRHFFGLSF